ncbi:hypothetical protein EEL30_13165 [Brevibacillus laterosporus]|uniref:4Fe-4S ferredoxin-type domain-containing protein n=1 Tax=Brevibacillus laterosporus TaxID=1465 RepID=A0A518V877_BRELA|nr:hypothetical protein EEL30_13165 [Brevibacillus laterosporus]
MNQLPGKIVDIDVLRINRNSNKRCQCTEKTFVIDPQNRAINCGRCGAPVDPYEAMYYLATEQEQLRDQVLNLLEQRKQIVNYKPHMLAFRDLERQSRGKKMLPTCPHCHRGFSLKN